MRLEKDLEQRSDSKCELCGATHDRTGQSINQSIFALHVKNKLKLLKNVIQTIGDV